MSPGASLRPTRIRPKAATSSKSCSSRAGMAIVQPDRGRTSGRVYTRPFRSRPVLDFRCVPLPYPLAPAAMKLARGAATTEIDRHCLLIARWSTLIAALVMLAWLALESAMIADAETVEQALAAIPSVIWNTSFGHILAAQTLALLGTSIALMIDRRWSWFNAVAFAGIAVVLQAGHSHALAMHQEALLLSQCLHLLAAGPWLGGLLPLLLLVR